MGRNGKSLVQDVYKEAKKKYLNLSEDKQIRLDNEESKGTNNER